MAKFLERQKALKLRVQGKSYSQIKAILGLSKSTLSYWLRDYPLSKERVRELRDCNQIRIERYRETMRIKKSVRLERVYKVQKKRIAIFSTRDLFIAGLFLYWGEGAKTRVSDLVISNTDPAVIKFFIFWAKKSLKVPKEKMRIYLHLYKNMNSQKEIDFWSKILTIPRSQFGKPYIKKTSTYQINHKGGFGHGTCNVVVGNVRIAEMVLMGIKVIQKRFSALRL